MPKIDGTGPEGKGVKTGRGLGKCNIPDNKNTGVFPKSSFKRGFGLGKGQGVQQRSGLRRGNR